MASVVEREDAIINKSIRMRVEFRYDRTGDLFDPDSIDEVKVLGPDHSTVLETIALGSITNPSVGKYYFETSTSWNTIKRKTFDTWKITVDGISYTLEASTDILESASPSEGIASFVTLVKLKVQAPTVGNVTLVDPTDYETLIKEAVKEYSERRPLQKTVKNTGDGTGSFSLPSDWEQEFSFIKEIEYPIDNFPPEKIDRKHWAVEQIDTGWTVRFYYSGYPGQGEFYYVRYFIRHTVDDASSTIPLADKDAVCNLAASLCCQALAEKYGQTSEPNMEADVVAYRTRGDEFAARAKELRELYDKKIKSNVNAVRGDYDMESYWPGNVNLMNRDRTDA